MTSIHEEKGEKKVSFLPFHAINEFMTSEYRLEVVRSTLSVLSGLPENYQNPINKLTGRLVKIPGFRHSLKAPAPLRIKPTVDAFEKSPDLVAAILAAWAKAHSGLRENVFALLQARGWEILPLDAERARLPGFITVWPHGENFEVLNQAFIEMFPDASASSDDVSLMVVWISGRLPYQFTEAEEASSESQESN
jgi:hypothetical protein